MVLLLIIIMASSNNSSSSNTNSNIVAIFYPFSQFCEINISLLSLQKQPNTAPNLFQRGEEYGKSVFEASEDPEVKNGVIIF